MQPDQPDDTTALESLKTPEESTRLPDKETLSLSQFNLLVKHYKRAVYEASLSGR